MILHVTSKADWLRCENEPHYAPPAFSGEGFIHACFAHQLEGVLERYFRGQRDLLLLHIDEKKLNTAVFLEAATPGGERFPHIYGFIVKEAIEKIAQIPGT